MIRLFQIIFLQVLLASILLCKKSTAQLYTGNWPTGVTSANTLLGAKYRSIRVSGTGGGDDVYTGVPDLGVAANRSSSNIVYPAAVFNFSIVWNPVTDAITTTTFIGATTTVTTYNNVSTRILALSPAKNPAVLLLLNSMRMEIRQQNATVTTVTNLVLDGSPIPGSYSNTTASSQFWYFQTAGLANGFTLTGTASISGTYGLTAELNRIQFDFGHDPGYLPLPLNWGPVTASFISNNNVSIKWQTLQEVNTSHFLLQRADNQASFETIATVTAAGNSAVAVNYTYIDNQARNKEYYYRLQQVDLDGKYSYSPVIKVKATAGEWLIKQTPQQLVVQHAGLKGFDYFIVNMAGQVLLHGHASADFYIIDLLKIPAGVYALQITGSNAQKHVHRFVK